MDFINAPEVETMAGDIIDQHHPHLRGVTLRYVFNEKEPTSGGKALWGRARKISGLQAHLAGEESEFFVIEIVYPVWRKLDEAKRRALVDHELCHCGKSEDKDGEEKLTIIPHDLEDFTCIVRRHGLWSPDVEQMHKAMQLSFDLAEAA